MATNKRRVNVTLSPLVDSALRKLSQRDSMTQSSKALQLLEMAIEFEEDYILDSVAQKRDTKNAVFVSHNDAWA